MLIHASCVAIGDKGVLLAGAPGAGKSDVALRLIDGGGELVSDDQTELRVEGQQLVAHPPVSISGLIDIRHVGIFKFPYRPSVAVRLYVELAGTDRVLERLPEPESFFLLDRPIEKITLPCYAASTPAKIRSVLSRERILGDL